MLHRKWREIKQQLIGRLDLALLGCCLDTRHFLCDILTSHPVQRNFKLNNITRIFSYGHRGFGRFSPQHRPVIGAGREPDGEERLAAALHDGVDEDGTAVELVEGLDGPVVPDPRPNAGTVVVFLYLHSGILSVKSPPSRILMWHEQE